MVIMCRVKNLFFPSWMIILKDVDGATNGSQLSKKLDISLSNLFDNMKRMKDEGLIDIVLEGRENKYILTEKGEKVQLYLLKVFEVF